MCNCFFITVLFSLLTNVKNDISTYIYIYIYKIKKTHSSIKIQTTIFMYNIIMIIAVIRSVPKYLPICSNVQKMNKTKLMVKRCRASETKSTLILA